MAQEEFEKLKKTEEYFNRQRRNIVLSSAILLFCNLTKASIGNINISGLSVSFQSEDHNKIIYLFIFFVVVYFYFRFKQYRFSYQKIIDKTFYEELMDRVNKMAYDYYYNEILNKILDFPEFTRHFVASGNTPLHT